MVVKEASEQAQRGVLPILNSPLLLNNALLEAVGKVIVLNELAIATRFPTIHSTLPITLIVGPEGGWSKSERAHFEKNNYHSHKLTTNILRSETAALAILAQLL